MGRKKIENRIRILIENGVKLGHRTLFAIVGDKARDQVIFLHHMLSKAELKARPSLLWCYKNELGFSVHRKKHLKHIQHKMRADNLNVNEEDPFELFLSSTKIRYCHYADTQKILGNTFGMCVLQDFGALTPNLLARTIETVEGGGLIIILLPSVASLKQFYTMTMDVHQKFRTEAHQNVTCRFNERFFLSLASYRRCLVVDDQLSVLSMCSHNLHVTSEEVTREKSDNEVELDNLKTKLRETKPVGNLINCCRTLDQGKALHKFIEAISEKTYNSTLSLTAARGRGKSATLGLSVAAAVAFGYSNIFVTSPSPENLHTFFEFVFKGLDALQYQEHRDYVLTRKQEFNNAIVKVTISKDHQQTIQYISPQESHLLLQAELVVIDEAAAIPLPFVKSMLGPYLIFLASTINGYEGTGRSLSLKLLQQIRAQAVPNTVPKKGAVAAKGRTLHEITLDESIRYKPGDVVEDWLTKLLCLDAVSVGPLLSGSPPADSCDLYYINRDALFSYNEATEEFLQRVVALLVASHYKNTPNDLQMMSDAPAHHLFCLLGPVDDNCIKLPEVLVVVQVCLEGGISKSSVSDGLFRGKLASGDLIPWTVAQQYHDPDFGTLCGARIVRIATHPDYQGMGYGSKALQLLKSYYKLNISNFDESQETVADIVNEQDADEELLQEIIEPKQSLPPLLSKLSERRPEHLDYLGVSFGLTESLLKFWKRAGYVPVYLGQKTNELTGEYSCIMVNVLNDGTSQERDWLLEYWTHFRRKFINNLSREFKNFPPALGLSVLTNTGRKLSRRPLSRAKLEDNFTNYEIKRLEMYNRNLTDYHTITDLISTLSRLYFLNQMDDMQLSALQSVILIGIGLQARTMDNLATELGILPSQLLGLFKKIIRKCVQNINSLLEENVEQTLVSIKDVQTTPNDLEKKQEKELQNSAQSSIKKSEDDLDKVSSVKPKNIIPNKSGEKRLYEGNSKINLENTPVKKKKKKTKNI